MNSESISYYLQKICKLFIKKTIYHKVCNHVVNFKTNLQCSIRNLQNICKNIENLQNICKNGLSKQKPQQNISVDLKNMGEQVNYS